MKKLIYLLLITFFILTPTALAVTPTSSPTDAPTQAQKSEGLTKEINDLKDKIASSVAKLKLVDNRGIIGTVSEITTTQITLTDIQGNIRLIDVDQITKFSSPDSSKDTTFGISDITKGMKISVIGKYNKENKRMLARFVSVVTLPTFLTGTVTDIDKDNTELTIATDSKIEKTISVQDITRTYSYDEDATETKSGFSKVVPAERVYVIGYPDKKDANKIAATRMLLFPKLPTDPHITAVIKATVQPTEEPTPTTGVRKRSVTAP